MEKVDRQQSTQQVVIFSFGETKCALPIESVREIIKYVEPQTTTANVSWLKGVISLRGRILPVYDVSSRLIQTEQEHTETSRILIMEGEGELLGLIVSDVEEVRRVGADKISPPPLGNSQLIDGILQDEEQLIMLLKSPDEIVREEANELSIAS